MEWLNYHHLLYFWVVAKEGSISSACKELRLAQPTISGQLKALEENLGEKLFQRAGRGLKLTEVGQLVYRYADQIFSLGRELQTVLREQPKDRPLTLSVGIADVLPKSVAYKLLEPARQLKKAVRIICREGRPERLLAELALHNLDIVLTDSPVPSTSRIKAFSHLLGESGLSLFGTAQLALRFRKGFPKSLNGAPMLLPLSGTERRAGLDRWFESEEIRPTVVGEFEDTALLASFGEAGDGIFPVPTIVESTLKRIPGINLIGRIDSVRERFYVISSERRLKHPGVVAISDAARSKLSG